MPPPPQQNPGYAGGAEAIEDVMRRPILRSHGHVEREGDADCARRHELGWWWRGRHLSEAEEVVAEKKHAMFS